MAHTDNVVAFWDLDNDSNDDSGNGHTGTDTAMSYDGNKATFNGSTSQITITPIATSSATYTIALWANIVSDPAYASLLVNTLGIYGLYLDAGKVDLYTGTTDHFSSGTVSAGSLHHIAVSVSAGTATFYIDGSSSGTASSIPDGTFSSLGNDNYTEALNGTLQSVALYTDAKDSTWVTADYNSGVPKKWADWQSAGFNPANSAWWDAPADPIRFTLCPVAC